MRLRDNCERATVSFCNFENRVNYEDQNIFQIEAVAAHPGFHRVRFCSFKNFSGNPDTGASNSGDDGVEPIRIGSKSDSQNSSKTIVENCYFTQCNGDDEVISAKASDCIYRFNTLDTNPMGELVLRHGDRAVVYGNFFLNGESGVRIREGSDHKVFNNYFTGLTSNSINLQASPPDANRPGVDIRVEDAIIAFNTFVNTDWIELGDNDSANDPLNTVIINNIFDETTNSSYFLDPTGTEIWAGNISNNSDDLFQSGDEAASVISTFTQTSDLSQERNAEGFYQLSSASIAIDAAVDNAVFPFSTITDLTFDNTIAEDITLGSRDADFDQKDVGAYEFSATTAVNVFVNEDNTGPSYLMPGAVLSSNDFGIVNAVNPVAVYPNPIIDNQINLLFNLSTSATVNIDLFDISGRKIITSNQFVLPNGPKVMLDLQIPTGIYVLQITNSDTKQVISVQKIIKQ